MTDRLILTRLLNATEKRQTHYIKNKTIRPRPAGSCTANVDVVQFVDFDISPTSHLVRLVVFNVA